MDLGPNLKGLSFRQLAILKAIAAQKAADKN